MQRGPYSIDIVLIFHNSTYRTQERQINLMVRVPPKKGPRMTRLSNRANMSQEEIERQEFEKERNANADRVFYAIEDARKKMSPKEREKADAEAEAILEKALGGAAPFRRRA